MADLSQLFGGVPQAQGGGRNPFALSAPHANNIKRRIVMREAIKQDLAPEDGDDFFQFVGNRLFELGDTEGAFAVQQQRQQIQAQQAGAEQQAFENNLALSADRRANEKAAREANPSQLVTLTDKEAQLLGFQPGAVVQKDTRTGELKVKRDSELLTPDEQRQKLNRSAASAPKISIGDKAREKAAVEKEISLAEATPVINTYLETLNKLNQAAKAGDVQSALILSQQAQAQENVAARAAARLQESGKLTDDDVELAKRSLPKVGSIMNAISGGDAFENQEKAFRDILGIKNPADITPDDVDNMSDEEVDAMLKALKNGG